MRKGKLWKRLTGAVLAAVMVAAGTFSGFGPFGQSGQVLQTGLEAEAASDTMTAEEIIYDMGLGWNLGNSLDSEGTSPYHETAWGNPTVTKELIQTVKAKGFNTIRIPTTWYTEITTTYDASGNPVYTINDNWMNRVQEVVDYAIDEDMYVILNIHHEKWINRSDFDTAYDSMSEELKQVWTQIATRFASYDQHLIFEGMNEPRAVGSSSIQEWVGNTACYEVINKLDNDFVDTVRSIAGNENRLLMVPQYCASAYTSISGNIDYSIFEDDMVAMSIHAYSPYEFAMGDGDHTDYNETYQAELKAIFDDINSSFRSRGIPVIIGEFSVSDYQSDASSAARAEWATDYLTYAKTLGIACVLWDNNAVGGNASENHGYINRSTLEWYPRAEAAVTAMLTVLSDTSVEWNSNVSEPVDIVYQHISTEFAENRISGNVSSGDTGNVNWTDLTVLENLFTENTEIAITYSGDTAPSITLINTTGGAWLNQYACSATITDLTNHVVYLQYPDVASRWEGAGAQNVKMVIGNQNVTVTGVYVLPLATYDGLVTSAARSITLDGSIGVNFYENFVDEVCRDTAAYVEIKDGTTTLSSALLSDAAITSSGYKFSGNVNALQMYDALDATLYLTNDVVIDLGNGKGGYSVADYAETAESDSNYPDLNLVTDALMDYADTVMVYKGKKELTADLQAEFDSLLAEGNTAAVTYSDYYEITDTDNSPAMDYAMTSLLIDTKIAIRHYFKVTDTSIDLSSYTKKGNYYYKEISSIAPVDYDEYQDMTYDNGSIISYSVLSYLYRGMNCNDTKLKYVCAALYEYYENAEWYFSHYQQ